MPSSNGGKILNLTALGQVAARLYQAPPDKIRNIDPSAWPSPLQPIQPIAPEGAEPLGWPFNIGQNLNYTPRPDAEYSADDLRKLAQYPIARILIENGKDQLCRVKRTFQPKVVAGQSKADRKKQIVGDKTLKGLNDFFDYPDGENTWSDWLRALLEDLFVIDAPSILLRRNKSGKILQLRVVPGHTITRYIDELGYTPEPPDPAFAQLWNGVPRVNLTTDQLVYKPRNIAPRNTIASYLYGFSPCEQLADEIQIGINRLEFVKAYYTKGSIPEAMQIVPNGVQGKQIRDAQDWINSELAGNLAARRGIRLIQGFTADGKDQIIFPKAEALTDSYDELHIRKLAFGFGQSPQRLLKSLNRATAQANEEAAEDEGLLPYLDWIKSIIDYIIQRKLGLPDYEMVFDTDRASDPEKQSVIDKADASIGKRTLNEMRDDAGLDEYPEDWANRPFFMTATGPVFLDDDGLPIAPEAPTSSEPTLVPRGGKPEPSPNPKDKAPNAKAMLNGIRIDTSESLYTERSRVAVERIVKTFFSKQAHKAQSLYPTIQKLKKSDDSKKINAFVDQMMQIIGWEELADQLDQPLSSAAQIGVTIGAQQLRGVSTTATIVQAQELARAWSHKRAAELVGKKHTSAGLVDNPNAHYAISATTREMLRADIERAFAAETPIAELAATLQEHGAFSEARAKTIARTEVNRAQSTGTYEAWKTSTVVKTVKWVVSSDGCCDNCADNEAAGAIPFGESFPSGATMPPQHVNCRCILQAVKIA